jgi:hypothetical protein
MASGTIKAVLSRSDVANNLTTSTAGKVLDASQGKILSDQIGTLNSNLEKLNSESNTTNDILVDALNVTGTKFFKAGSSYTGSVPNSFYKYGTFEVFTRGTTKIVIAQSQAGEMAINTYYSSAWSGWNELALNSKMAKSATTYASHYFTSAGTKTYTLPNSKTFLLIVNTWGSADSNSSGLYIVSANLYAGNVRAIAQSNTVTVSLTDSKTNLEITASRADISFRLVEFPSV